MGREIYCQIRSPGKTWEEPIWDSAAAISQFVCGRDDATGYIASLGGEEGEIDISKRSERDNIRGILNDYAERDKSEIEKAKNLLRDLRYARRNARNYGEFDSFSDAIEATEEWIESEGWSRAQALLDLIDKSTEEFTRHRLKYRGSQLYIVVSE